MFFLERYEQIVELAHALRGAKEQIAIGTQRIVEGRNHLALQIEAEIDQQVAAGDQVDAGKGWVANHVVWREDAQVAHFLGHREAAAIGDEKAFAPFGRDAVEQRARILGEACDGEGVVVDIGGEDLDARHDIEPVHVLAQQDGERVDLFAGGAAGDPDPHDIVGAALLKELGHDHLGELLERLGIAKEVGDIDQQIAKQRAHFVLMTTQVFDIRFQIVDLHHLHAPLHAPHKGLGLVAAEVVADLAAQNAIDLRLGMLELLQLFLCAGTEGRVVQHVSAVGELGEFRAHCLDRNRVVDKSRGDGAVRHAGMLRPEAVGSLRHRHAAAFLDGLEIERAVRVAAGQHHAHRQLALVFRE